MATISSHTLNGTNGTHATGVRIRVINSRSQAVLCDDVTDSGGRFSVSVNIADASATDQFEMTCYVGDYWAAQSSTTDITRTMNELVLRFAMPDPDALYHMPFILSPSACSCWWSAPE